MQILNYFASLSPQTLLRLLPGNIAQGLIWGLLALGVFITYKILDFADLTVDGSFATGGAVCVMLMIAGVPGWIAVLLAAIAGGVTGLVTGLLHTKLGIPGILASILTQIALYSVNLHIIGKANQSISVDKIPLLLSSRHNGSAIAVGAVFCVVVIALLYWYFGTEQGCAIRATGSCPTMASAQGINISTMKLVALILGNALVALSGALNAQYQGFADVSMGRGAIVIGLAAVIIGEVLFKAIMKKKQNFAVRMGFTVLGSVLYYIFIGFALWLKMPTNDMKLITAVIVAIFLAVPYLQEKKRSSFARAARNGGKKNA